VLLLSVMLTARLLVAVSSRVLTFSLAEMTTGIAVTGSLLGLTGIGAATSARSAWTAASVAILIVFAVIMTFYLSPPPQAVQAKSEEENSRN
jgi:hypothetical protein